MRSPRTPPAAPPPALAATADRHPVDPAHPACRAERVATRAGAAVGPPAVADGRPGRAARGHGLAALAEHNDDEHGWWLALDGRVHDVTGFVRDHPGRAVLRAHAGLDATTAADRALLDRPELRRLLTTTDTGPLLRPALDRARGLHDAWVAALTELVRLQNAFRLDRSSAECADPCPPDGDRPCARAAERAAATAARFGDEHLPRFAAEVLAPLAERVLRDQRATALRIRTVPGGPREGLLPGCSPRRRLDLLDRRIGATKTLLTGGVRCFDRWGDAVLGTGELWRLAAQAVPGCAGATTLSVHTTRRAG